MTRTRPSGRPLMTATALAALLLAAPPAQAGSWSTIAFIPANQVTVSFDRSSVTSDHHLTRAWFLFTYMTPITTAESFVFKSYKQYEIIDCKRRASFTAAFTAFSEADGGGRTIYTWSGPNAVLPQLNAAPPGSVAALMIDAACEPPLPKLRPLPPDAPAAASAASAASAPMPASSITAPMATPAPVVVRPLP